MKIKSQKIKKKVAGTTENGTKYKVQGLVFYPIDEPRLLGNIEINREKKSFYIVFGIETRYGLVGEQTDNEFYNALVHFYQNHLGFGFKDNEIQENGDIILKRIVRII